MSGFTHSQQQASGQADQLTCQVAHWMLRLSPALSDCMLNLEAQLLQGSKAPQFLGLPQCQAVCSIAQKHAVSGCVCVDATSLGTLVQLIALCLQVGSSSVTVLRRY